MDPYLEEPTRWPDVHQRLITYIADALQPQLRPRYYARMGERVYIVQPPQALYPDVMVIERPVREATSTYLDTQTAGVEALVDAPIILTLSSVEHREPFVEIVHATGDESVPLDVDRRGTGEVVTVIEVLSPANKTPGEGHNLYRRKQQLVLDSPVHLVEIDLLAAGLPTVAIPEESLVELPSHRYLVSVRRASDRYRAEVYPVPLPRLGIPLREPDPDVVLDLPAVLTQCYDNGGYADLVDYRQPPPGKLSAEEAAWLDGLLKWKGLRPS